MAAGELRHGDKTDLVTRGWGLLIDTQDPEDVLAAISQEAYLLPTSFRGADTQELAAEEGFPEHLDLDSHEVPLLNPRSHRLYTTSEVVSAFSEGCAAAAEAKEWLRLAAVRY